MFVALSDPIYDEISQKVRQTYKNACIVWMEKVENKYQQEMYEKYKSTFTDRNINEKQLFHGTSEDVCRKIIREGFRPELNAVSAHGKGVYFSISADYSKNYSIMKSKSKNEINYLLYCNVITGTIGKGSGKVQGCDSYVDRLQNPTMYVIGKKEACLPLYLIAFYPNAK